MNHRYLFTGGGTAGSVTPLLAIIDRIKQNDPSAEFLFIGTTYGPERLMCENKNIQFTSIASGKLRRYFSWTNISDLFNIIRGFFMARKIINRWSPQVAVSAGSFVSVPVIWAAHITGIKTLIHQQDVRTGLANRLMAGAADVITTSFKSSVDHFPSKKVTWTGNPVRSEILQGDCKAAQEYFNIHDQLPVLLVMGGGTGSAAINIMIGGIAHRLVKEWHIIHITGPDRDFIELHDDHYHRYKFLTWEMPLALCLADVVICRAGLGTISELAALKKAAIFMPMPHTHQEDNAAEISKAAAGMVITSAVPDRQQVMNILEELRTKPAERTKLGLNLNHFYNPGSLEYLTETIIKLSQT